MRTKIKLIVGLIVVLAGGIIFCLFAYPDQQLEDFSDLYPIVSDVEPQNNSYFMLEKADESFKKPKYEPSDMISFLTQKPLRSASLTITSEDIKDFLLLEDSTLQLLDKAQQLNYYKNPAADKINELTFSTSLPKLRILPIKTLYIKGLSEFMDGDYEVASQTIRGSLGLVYRMRAGSISVLEYSVYENLMNIGKQILVFMKQNGASVESEALLHLESFDDKNRNNYINVLKFQFQVYKNSFDEVLSTLSGINNNNYFVQKNATYNELAKYIRMQIDETKHFNCSVSVEAVSSSSSPWLSLLTPNSVGKLYLKSVAVIRPRSVFCRNI